MKYMLDTNICIYIIKKKPIKVIKKLKRHKISDIGISSITLSELEYGVQKSQYPHRNKLALLEFIAPLEIYSFDENSANIYGSIRADLEKKGEIIGPLDLFIASQAIALNCTLVTNNIREFKRISGIKLENWVV